MDGTVQMCLKDTDSTTGFSLNILWSPKAVKKDDEQQQGNNTCETDRLLFLSLDIRRIKYTKLCK